MMKIAMEKSSLKPGCDKAFSHSCGRDTHVDTVYGLLTDKANRLRPSRHQTTENEYIPDAGPEDKDTRKAYCLLCDNNNTVGWACSKCMLMMCDHCQHYHQLFSDEEHNLCQIQPDVNAWKTNKQYISMDRQRNDSPRRLRDGPTTHYSHDESVYEDAEVSPYDDFNPVPPYDTPQPLSPQPAPPLPPRPHRLPLPSVNPSVAVGDQNTDDYDDLYFKPSQPALSPPKPSKADSKPSSSATAPDTVYYSGVVRKVPSWLSSPKEQVFKWSKAKVSSVCSVGNEVFFFGQVTEKRKEQSLKMAVFEADGRKLLKAPMTSHVTSMALFEAGQDRRLVLVQRGSPCLQWINAQDFLSSYGEAQLSDVRQVYVKNPVLSKPAPGQPLYVLGISEEGETEMYKVLTKRSTPPLHVPYKGTVHAIDVSSDGQYVAVLGTQGSDREIDVYQRNGQQAILVSGFSSDDKAGSCDICFYVPKGAQQEIGEVLMVAERNNGCLRLLDHVTNCRPVGKLPVDSPVCFTKSDKGQLWLVCDPKPDEVNVLVF